MAPTRYLTAADIEVLLHGGTVTGDWALDPLRSRIGLKTGIMGSFIPVTGVFDEISATGAVSPAGDVTGVLTMAAGSFRTENLRRDKHLHSADFFDAAHYPDITFTLVDLRPSGEGATVNGTLTVRDHAGPLSFDVAVSVPSDGEVWLEGELPINRVEFGLTWRWLGMPSMTTTVTIHAMFTRR
jgi:polyisoprenoid-binding protein YceI